MNNELLRFLKLTGMMKNLSSRLLFVLILAFASTGSLFAQKDKIDFKALTEETQKQAEGADELTLVWWLPESFWRASLRQDSNLTPLQTEDFLKVIRPYTMLVVVDGRIDTLGSVTYKTEAALRNNLLVSDARGNAFRPLVDGQISAEAKNLLSVMKPILVNMLGRMGQNMHIFLFPSKNLKSEEIVNELKEGVFKVRLDTREFKWRLPLGSLLSPKVCPIDGEKQNGAWKFCPFHGVELKNQ